MLNTMKQFFMLHVLHESQLIKHLMSTPTASDFEIVTHNMNLQNCIQVAEETWHPSMCFSE